MRAASHRPVSGLYPIIDVDLCRLRGMDPLALAAACLAGGARLLQIRQKTPGTGPLIALTTEIVRAAAAAGGLVIVNDRADVAALSQAAGVHVGQEDLPVAVVRGIVGGDAIIGLSTHTPAQVDAALEGGADYVAVGPVFRTSTKETGYEPRGLEMVRYAAGRGKPIVAIGGITLDNACEVVRAGASAVAVISDLLSADPESRVREYVTALGKCV